MAFLKGFFDRPGERFLRRKGTFFLLFLMFLINGLNWYIIAVAFAKLEDFVPLHHNVYFGIDLIGEREKLFFQPLLGLLIIIINVGLAVILSRKDRFHSKALMYVAIGAQAVLLTSTYLTLSLR